MNKKIVSTLAVSIGLALFSFDGNSAEIDIKISGQGSVSLSETEEICAKNCILSSELNENTLIAIPNDGSYFKGWTGQTCSAGEGAIISSEVEIIMRAEGGAKTLYSGDVNGDSHIDLVSISLFDGKIHSLINNGLGKFSANEVATDLIYPSALSLYDWDGDSDLDLLVVEHGKKQIKLYSNNGTGSFEFNKDLFVAGVKPYAIAVTDVNSDNQPDIVISSFEADTSEDLFVLVNSITDPDVSIFKNSGSDTFTFFQNISKKATITLDANKNDTSDEILVVAAEILEDSIAIYAKSEMYAKANIIDTGGASYGAAFGDVDMDGNIDVISAHYRPASLNIIYGNDNGAFNKPMTLAKTSEGVTATAVGDFNNDSFPDIATGQFNNKLFYYYPSFGYENCVVTKDEKISLTANFELLNEATPTSPTINNETSKGGSGGSMPLHLFFLMLSILGIRQLAYAKNQN